VLERLEKDGQSPDLLLNDRYKQRQHVSITGENISCVKRSGSVYSVRIARRVMLSTTAKNVLMGGVVVTGSFGIFHWMVYDQWSVRHRQTTPTEDPGCWWVRVRDRWREAHALKGPRAED